MTPGQGLQGYDELRRRLAAVSGPVLGRGLMGTLGAAAVREQKLLLYQKVNRRTGQSGRQIHLGEVTASSAKTVATGTALFADRGTKAHPIAPRYKKALMFSASGTGTRLTGSVASRFRGPKGLVRAAKAGVSIVFAKHVEHPGTKAHPYMVEGASKSIEKAGLADRIVAAWNDAA